MRNNYLNQKNEDAQAVQEEEKIERPEQSAPLGKSQKIAVAVLAFFAILVFTLWIVNFRKSISEPFTYKGESKQSNIAEEDSEESLRQKDTDQDGLSDWDELYFYKTSPYLEDSDSDGFSDKEEIDNNKDPNCPTGRDCSGLGIVEGEKQVVEQGSETPDSTLNNLLEQFNASEPSQESGAEALDLGALFSEDMDAVTLRQLLIEYGLDKEILDKFTDEELMQSFKEVSQ